MDKWNYILYVRDKVIPNYDVQGNVLEIGCGRRGWLSLMLRSYFQCFIITTDIQRDKVRKAKEIATSLNLESNDYVVADSAHLPFRDKTFQKIVGNAVLHHMLDFIDVVAKEMRRVMKNGGTAIFTAEIVASRFLGWIWKKIALEKVSPEEGIQTLSAWRKPFLKAGFVKVEMLCEPRCGYTWSILRGIYYNLINRLPKKFVLKYTLTSATILLGCQKSAK